MEKLNEIQLESLKVKIEKEIPLSGLSFNIPYGKFDKDINFIVLERYNYNLKIIYLIVPLQQDEQFNRLHDLEQLMRELTVLHNANFGYFGTCSFEKDTADYLALTELPII